MAQQLEFFFDCSSPWTYLAFERVLPVARAAAANLVWRPVLVGGVFNKVNQSVYEQRANPVPAKARYSAKDLQDWARLTGITIRWPSVFPVRSVTAMRGCFHAIAHGKIEDYARALFRAYWTDDADISQPDVIAACAASASLDGDALLAHAASGPAKDALLANTEELMARGGFGSPTIFLDSTDMYFGNDRMELVAHALGVPGTLNAAARQAMA
jgi:2-hydroxychromene-2-carboxylate isomerase